jgi:starch-binding outer membrane protein, SusD/RagB family
MRTRTMTLIAPLAALSLAVGCMDNPLDIYNPNQRTVEQFWQDEGDALAAMNAVYRTLLEDGTYGRNRYWVWARTDTYMSRSPATNILNFTRSVVTNLADGMLNGMWNHPWQGVFRANQIIHNVPNITAMTPAVRDRIMAEARFIRALYHFEQAVVFGDVPIITEPAAVEDQPVFRPEADVYAAVIADAMAAAPSLAWKYTGADIGRVTRGGALALAADAHMMRKEWSQAVTLLNQIVASGQYSLLPDYGALFQLPSGENSVESLFEVQFGDDAMTTLGARGNINPRLVGPQQVGFSDTQLTEWGFQQFFAEFGPRPENPDPRLFWTSFWNQPGGMDVFGRDFAVRYPNGFREANVDHTYFWKKGQEYWRDRLTDFFNPINLKIYRYGGVLLMLAEALVEDNKPAEAAVPLNLVRARVGLPPVPNDLGQAEMRQRVNHELIMEMSWEHSTRLKYLKRQGLLTKEYLTPRNPAHAAVFTNGKSERLPIPQAEIDRNPNAQQNPGW